jgi:hypothetical protein
VSDEVDNVREAAELLNVPFSTADVKLLTVSRLYLATAEKLGELGDRIEILEDKVAMLLDPTA